MNSTTGGYEAKGFFSPNPDPTQVDVDNPLILFIIQTIIIIALSRFLSIFLGKIRQPRVIAEVVGGILLGPTAFGAIPGFTDSIFPEASLTYLKLISELGLVLFLFLVGLEIDFALFRKNLKVSLAVGTAGLVIPFALGCVVSLGLYREFIDPEVVRYEYFLLFISTSMSITAFPVLARILTELNLVGNPVGLVVLSAGVLNDVVGWALLALTISLVFSASTSSLTILYVILCSVAWMLFLWYLVKPALMYAGRKTGSFEGDGPSQLMITLVLVVVLVSAFVVDRIGINAIFGGFVAGLVMPKRSSFARSLTEKVEDLVTVLFVPVYFALSGLQTNLLLLSTGIIWAWVVCVISVAFVGKFVGCFFAAKWCGFSNRASGAVGSLMAAKGLIELIFLNIGLEIGIISPTVFAIFVLEAVTLTVASTPLTLWFYPPSVRGLETVARGKNENGEEVSRGKNEGERASGEMRDGGGEGRKRTRFSFIITERLSNLAPIMIFSKLLARPAHSTPYPPHTSPHISPSTAHRRGSTSTQSSTTLEKSPSPSDSEITIDALRLIELSARTSAVMHASEPTDESRMQDPIGAVFETFASLNGIKIGEQKIAVVPREAFAETAVGFAVERESDFVLLPWRLSGVKDEEDGGNAILPTALESIFGHTSSTTSSFIRRLFLLSTTDVGLFIDRGLPPSSSSPILANHYHIFCAFHGGSDHRTCLELLVQLVSGGRGGILATVVQVVRTGEASEFDLGRGGGDGEKGEIADSTPGGTRAGDTIYPTTNTLTSSTADALALASLSTSISIHTLPITHTVISTSTPLRASLSLARTTASSTNSRFIIFAGRGRRDAVSHREEAKELLRGTASGGGVDEGVRKGIGEAGMVWLDSGIGSALLIMQSAEAGGVGAV